MRTGIIRWRIPNSRYKREGRKREMKTSRRVYLAENAVASVIFSLGTGNFIAGLLSFMGAPPATCALIGAFPQLGCVMQLISPFLFERLRRRKGCIILCCFGFRFLLGMAGVIPLLFSGGGTGAVVPIYLVAFLMAGFVTPGLSQWIMDLAPGEKRGSFFAKRDILSSALSAGIILLMSRLLDGRIAVGKPQEGYLIVFSTVAFLAIVDALLLTRITEPRESKTMKLMPQDLLRPFVNRRFRPIIVFIALWFFTQNLSSGFLAVYQLTVLKLDHSMIAAMALISSALGIVMSFVWGRVADKVGFKRLMLYGCMLMAVGYMGWCFLPVSRAYLAPLVQCVTMAGSGAYGMANLNIQYQLSPEEGKTAYLGVTAAVSNLMGYAAVLLGAQAQPLLANSFGRSGIPVLFAASAVGFGICILFSKRIADM